MKQEITRPIRTDRLGLTDLVEKLAGAGLCLSDVFLRGQTFRLRVAGWSMSPTLHTGDRITVEPASPAQLQVGDLLLFHHRGQLICHRLVAMQETGAGPRLITKGDAATGCDAPLHPDQVLGRVVGVAPNWLARLRNTVAQGLLALQGLRAYRRMMRALLSRGIACYVGMPEGRRWFRYHPIGGRRPPVALVDHQRFHLVARLAGICVGSVRVEARAEGFWLQGLYVRIPYRGLGVGSHLVALACDLATACGARTIRAVLDHEHGAARGLFEKLEFRPPLGDGARSCSDLTRRMDPFPREAPDQSLARPFWTSPATTGQQLETLTTFQSCGQTARLRPEAQPAEDRPGPRG